MNLEKQFRFALSKALTSTAFKAKDATKAAIKRKFTVRNNWLDSPVGPRVLPASKTELSTAVVLKKDFLNLFTKGGIKLPGGKYIAVPTKNVRRNKQDIVTRRNRPKQLQRTFIGTGKSGRKIIFQQTGKGKNRRVRAMYVLIPQAEIKAAPTITIAVPKTFEREFSNLFFAELRNAIRTAR